jgi:hypothetical protein
LKVKTTVFQHFFAKLRESGLLAGRSPMIPTFSVFVFFILYVHVMDRGNRAFLPPDAMVFLPFFCSSHPTVFRPYSDRIPTVF